MPRLSGRQLAVSNLQHVDRGNLATAINHALRQAIADVSDRPGEKTARKVLIEVAMRPVLDKTTAVLDTAEVQFRVRVKIPDRVSEAYPMLPQSDGTLTFQPDCPENPRQMSLLPDDDDAPEAPEASQAPDDTDETVG